MGCCLRGPMGSTGGTGPVGPTGAGAPHISGISPLTAATPGRFGQDVTVSFPPGLPGPDANIRVNATLQTPTSFVPALGAPGPLGNVGTFCLAAAISITAITTLGFRARIILFWISPVNGLAEAIALPAGCRLHWTAAPGVVIAAAPSFQECGAGV